MTQTMHILPVISAAANILMWVWLLFMCRAELVKFFAGFGRRTWIFLGALTAAQIVLHCCVVSQKHILFIDEFWYLEAGKNIMVSGTAPGYEKSIGWPVLTALSYFLGGLNNYAPIKLATLFGILSVPAAYFSIWLLTENIVAAEAATLVFGLLPYKLIWSSTAETIAAALFFILAGVLFSLLYYRGRERKTLWLCAVTWGMAAQIRPENLMFFALFAAGLFIYREREKPADYRGEAAAFGAALLLNLSNLAVFLKFQTGTNWLQVESGGTISGSNFSLANLLSNTLEWGPKFFTTTLHPAAFTVCMILGAALMWKGARKALLFLSAWFLLMYCFYFSAWFASYGTTTDIFPKTKLFTLFYPVMCAMAGVFIAWVYDNFGRAGKITAATLMAGMLAGFATAKNAKYRASGNELETAVVSSMKNYIPPNCVIVTNAPAIINSVNFYKTVYAPAFARSREVSEDTMISSSCILYFDDMTNTFGIPEFQQAKEFIESGYKISDYKVFGFNSARLAFRRVQPADTAATASGPEVRLQ